MAWVGFSYNVPGLRVDSTTKKDHQEVYIKLFITYNSNDNKKLPHMILLTLDSYYL